MDIEIIKELKTLSERIGDVERKLSLFYDKKHAESTENIEIVDNAVESVMEDVIPSQALILEDLATTVDTLMTDIIPSLMGGE